MNRTMRALTGLLAVVIALLAGCQTVSRQQASGQDGPYRVERMPEDEVPLVRYAAEAPAAGDPSVILRETPLSTSSKAVKEEFVETRAVWISYLEMNQLLKGKTEKQFTAGIAGAFDNVKSFGLNTVIVQVRPFGDALYQSSYFPWSYTVTGTEGQDPGFDPLAVMVREAKERGLRIEAWINPYRIRAAGNTNALSSGNPARQWLDKGKDGVIQYNGVLSYNPASSEARNLIVNGAAEIVRNYGVDGIHIDDYFYPTTDAEFDKAFYDAYRSGGGKLSLADWRRSNVEELVRGIYKAVKKENPNVLFGISPQSSVDNNYNFQYLDVKKIAGSEGFCDYVCPQIYFGYDNDTQPYKKTLQQWSDLVKGSPVKLYVGLAAYKVGAADSWAGNGKNEWVNHDNLLRKMVDDARKAEDYQGFALYRYDSLFNPESTVSDTVKQESENLRSIL